MSADSPQSAPGPGPSPDPEVVELATRLFDMARSGDAATLGGYVDAGVPVNLRNQSGDSLLMLAAYHGHASAVSALLSRGADPDLANDRGQTPLAGAVFKGFDDVVRVLVDAGADPHAGTPSAADAAAMFGRDDLRALWS
ncbi:ankyrin repeat domain-containing protein [Gordonia amicalis]|uniref:ankyrin repeat domain-containing protein n=1 Tax=Gordonia amicalis TaxID=89053 RepID=UPI0022B587D0|nr:ankyrin repeat domain-containing protein [Gordonia amicalis]MCZ4580389.1 ankyrin repeat domain-containing protein [Gordonia amicalis]